MYPSKDSYINIHTHHKPRLREEFVVRNAYLPLHTAKLVHLNYGISCGVHPWFSDKYSTVEVMAKLTNAVSCDKVLAVGEIGMDLSISIPLNIQRQVFEVQLEIASQKAIPVIIHAVKTYYDFVPYLKSSGVCFIFHQFNGNTKQAEALLEHGAILSFGKNLFNYKSDDVLRFIPEGHFFLETDTSNHVHIADIYRKAAEIRNTEEYNLKEELFNTFVRVFGNKQQ